jgi:hypothetical protein
MLKFVKAKNYGRAWLDRFWPSPEIGGGPLSLAPNGRSPPLSATHRHDASFPDNRLHLSLFGDLERVVDFDS